MLRRDQMRILYLAPWVTVGGADRATIEWLRTLPDQQMAAALLTTQESDNALLGEAERWAEETWCLPELMPGEEMPDFILSFVERRRIDVVHVMNSKLGFDLLPALKARDPHLRTVVQLHAEEFDHTGYPSYVATRFDAAVDAYSVVSEDLKRQMLEYGVEESKVHVIYLGVDTATFDPARTAPAILATEGPFPILYPHRLTEQKDPLLMVAIMEALRREGSAAVIHVVGDGDLRPMVEAAVDRAGLRDRILLHGARSDLAGWYQATRATLLTSRFEGIPLVVYEAMAMQRPVVAAAVNGTHEVLDAECGFLIQPRDSVPAYVAALLRLEREPGLTESQGETGRRRILAHFTVEHMATGHAVLYRQLVAEDRAAW